MLARQAIVASKTPKERQFDQLKKRPTAPNLFALPTGGAHHLLGEQSLPSPGRARVRASERGMISPTRVRSDDARNQRMPQAGRVVGWTHGTAGPTLP